MTDRTCNHCSGPIPLRMRADARYCCKSCREMASRARSKTRPELPKALTQLPRWIRRASDKTPLRVSGGAASSTDPGTWSSYAEAEKSRTGAGLGLVLNGDGIVCVDLDHCISPDGTLSAEARKFIDQLPPTYIEISPSGTGLHIWGRGLVLTSRKIRRAGLPGEVIGGRKYVTVTGRRFEGAPLTLANIARPAGALIY